ncbi:MAG TPA: hypothetical protein VFB63_12425 [Bryobacteraceae bacterium]|nr:hypothetical protein [Bryobacteraceae bacterium]
MKSLRAGERVWVQHRDGKTIRHRKAVASTWSPGSLTIRYKDRDLIIPRGDLLKLSTYAGKSRAKGAGYGALAGAAAGAAVYGILALSADDLDVSPALIIGGAALLFGGIGAVAGLFVGATKTQTIYRAKMP